MGTFSDSEASGLHQKDDQQWFLVLGPGPLPLWKGSLWDSQSMRIAAASQAQGGVPRPC